MKLEQEVQLPKIERAQIKFTEQELWQKYLNLAKELLKAINKGDIDLFLNLVNQRDTITKMLKEYEPYTFKHTPEWEKIKSEVMPLDNEIMYKAKTWLNKSKRQTMAVKSYDITNFVAAGNVFNKEY